MRLTRSSRDSSSIFLAKEVRSLLLVLVDSGLFREEVKSYYFLK
jgi:hypothetical protein